MSVTSSLKDFVEYWWSNKDNIGPCYYSTAYLARLTDEKGNYLFSGGLDYLLHQLHPEGYLLPRASLSQHNLLITTALYNTLLMRGLEEEYREEVDRLTTFLALVLDNYIEDNIQLVTVDLLLTKELQLFLKWSNRADLKEQVARLLPLFLTRVNKRFGRFDKATFLKKQPQTLLSLDAIPEDYYNLDFLDKLFHKLGSILTTLTATAVYYEKSSNPLALEYLKNSYAISGGKYFMMVTPNRYFSIPWILGNLMKAQINIAQHFSEEIEHIKQGLGPYGIGGTKGLPTDSDTTAMVLTVLHYAGQELGVNPLVLENWYDEEEQAYGTYHKKNTYTPDASANIRVLNAYLSLPNINYSFQAQKWQQIIHFLERIAVSKEKSTAIYWVDRWNISPLYPLHEIVITLSKFYQQFCSIKETTIHHQAVQWILEQQHPLGYISTTGNLDASQEETAYALLALKWYYKCCAGQLEQEYSSEIWRAIQRAEHYLAVAPKETLRAQLWVGKTLYQPTIIVKATITAAQLLAV